MVTFASSTKEKSNLLICEASTNTLIGHKVRFRAIAVTFSRSIHAFSNVQGGYRTARASHGISHGSWYYEIKVMPCAGNDGHVRAGWLTREADLACPVGFAEDSYAVRDLDGSKINVAYRKQYMKRKIKVGDVLGCLIQLSGDQGSVRFTLNGEVFENAYDTVRVSSRKRYFPAVSLYMQGKVQWNFGPKFAFPPKDLVVEDPLNYSKGEGDEKSGASTKKSNVIRPMSEACKAKYQQRIIGSKSDSRSRVPTPPPVPDKM